jgi:hypothetical protein
MALQILYLRSGAVAASAGPTIAGQATERYQATLDLEADRETIPEQYAEALDAVIAELQLGGIARRMNAEAWVAEDGLIHRLRYTYRLGLLQGGGTMSTTIDFRDFSAPIDLRIPERTDVVRIEDVAPGPLDA